MEPLKLSDHDEAGRRARERYPEPAADAPEREWVWWRQRIETYRTMLMAGWNEQREQKKVG